MTKPKSSDTCPSKKNAKSDSTDNSCPSQVGGCKTIYVCNTKQTNLNTPNSYKGKCGFTFKTKNNEYSVKYTFTIKETNIKHNVNIFKIIGTTIQENTTTINTKFEKNFQFKTKSDSKTINAIINDVSNNNYASTPDNPNTFNNEVAHQISKIETKKGKTLAPGEVSFNAIGKSHEDGSGDTCGCGYSSYSCLNSTWYTYLSGCSTYAYEFNFGYCNGTNESSDATASATIAWYYNLPTASGTDNLASGWVCKSGSAPSTFTTIYKEKMTNKDIHVYSQTSVVISDYCDGSGSGPGYPCGQDGNPSCPPTDC
jgi:hypothetical protein